MDTCGAFKKLSICTHMLVHRQDLRTELAELRSDDYRCTGDHYHEQVQSGNTAA